MRNNLPITTHEVFVAEGHAIVSKTDLKGKIVYVNPHFVEISGFSEQELLGSPQNIVRHPDMPPEAFADMWSAIMAGEPWTGLVKNRCKNGDFYWVRANVTPLREQGRLTGFMSVRVKPGKAEVATAERAYQLLRSKAKGHPRIEHGELVYPGWRHLLARLRDTSLAMRIWLATSVVNVLLLGVCFASLMGSNSGNALLSYGIFCATGLGFLINVFLWYTLRTAVIAPLAKVLIGARAIAAGDLSQHFDTRGKDEMGQLTRALQQMHLNLVATIGDVRSNVDTIANATRQIAVGNQDLSSRTEAQAASLEQTASSMDQFSSTVKENAANSVRASGLAAGASQVAVEGGAIVADVIATMSDINESSKHIVDIIGLIEGIAFQTNILALNAAVEAARAGEQGKGFAVVAGEVRSLAQRSSVAAKEIKSLIDKSVEKVGNGVLQAGKAGQTMKHVVDSVKEVTSIMEDISRASYEQSIGIDQVNKAIAHLDQVTQQNAALVEEAAAAAVSLDHDALGLTQTVSVFKFAASPTPAQLRSFPVQHKAQRKLAA